MELLEARHELAGSREVLAEAVERDLGDAGRGNNDGSLPRPFRREPKEALRRLPERGVVAAHEEGHLGAGGWRLADAGLQYARA